MIVTDRTHPADRVFAVLKDQPYVVRSLFTAYHYDAPWMGWLPMLCEICRDVRKGEARND
jgi:hypothetical protein